MLDPESLMFSVDWESINEWFERRAKEAGHSKYTHVETFEVPIPTPDPVVFLAAESLGKAFGESIDEIYGKTQP